MPVSRKKARPRRTPGTNPRRVADAEPIRPNAAYVLPNALRVPDAVANRLKIALAAARDAGESWESLEGRTLVSHQQLLNILKGSRRVTAPVVFRLAAAFGFELQLSLEKRAKRAA